MNKQERWVRGTKIDISKGLDEYYKIRDYHRERNLAMGYGHIDTNEKKYKKNLSDIKKITNIATTSHTLTSEATDNYHKNKDLDSNLNF